MSDYYSESLSGEHLKKCYDIAPPRVKQYFREELSHVLTQVKQDDYVLELGCGYGRFLAGLRSKSKNLVGIDTSLDSLLLAKELHGPKLEVHQMNAGSLCFRNGSFDVVICIQNGVSAFKVNPIDLFKECIRVTRKGGVCLFSSYSSKFWEDRIEWFRLQSEEGLLGEIDWHKTKDGNIVCKDGFIATTFSEDDFQRISMNLELEFKIVEVDESSLFCEVYI